MSEPTDVLQMARKVRRNGCLEGPASVLLVPKRAELNMPWPHSQSRDQDHPKCLISITGFPRFAGQKRTSISTTGRRRSWTSCWRRLPRTVDEAVRLVQGMVPQGDQARIASLPDFRRVCSD